MKTIISIIEVLIYNLLPPVLATQVVMMVKDIVPLVGIAFIKIGSYLAIRLQYLQKIRFQKPQAKLFKLDNIFPIDRNRMNRSHA